MASKKRSDSVNTDIFSQQLTPFIGRHQEIAEIEGLLADLTSPCRLLTLVGPGGIGKTRLALVVAAGQQDEYADGVHFVSLQSINSVEPLITAIVDGLGFSLHGRDDPQTQLLAHLREREMLIVLDNFEQLLPVGGTELLTAMLDHAPAVTLLVTSREVLNLQQEWLYPVQGLSLPDDENDDFEEFDAVQLFVERARRIRPDFSLSDERQHDRLLRIFSSCHSSSPSSLRWNHCCGNRVQPLWARSC